MKQGILQSLGVTAYVTLIGLFMSNANNILGKGDTFATPIFVLLLLSVSVLICGLIVFFKPYKLFIAGKKKEAFETVIYTTLGLFVILVLFLLGMIIFR